MPEQDGAVVARLNFCRGNVAERRQVVGNERMPGDVFRERAAVALQRPGFRPFR